MEYTRVPAFDYTSAFAYRTDPDDQQNDEQPKQTDPFQKAAYFCLVTLSLLFFVVTSPVSSFFCIKKINSLQRCLTHRLGRRLPLKGPGFILKLPFVDQITIIDLFEERFYLIKSEEQLLTGDGSIIQMRPVQASLHVTNAVLTTLKVGDVDVKNCLQLRFANTIHSAHVEDLENRIDYFTRLFEEESNDFLKKWGYSVKVEDTPQFTVIERSDPLSSIKGKLHKLFAPKENPVDPRLRPDDEIRNFLNPIAGLNSSPVATPKRRNSRPIDGIVPVLQFFVDQYKKNLAGYPEFNLKMAIKNGSHEEFEYYFRCSQGIVQPSPIIPKQYLLKIEFASEENFETFLVTKDVKYCSYSFSN